MKQLTEMSDEELGTLFPIILTEHKKDWAKLYDQEERILYDTIGKNIYRIDHIGSTAVEQLIAKPTIDILLEINGETNTNELIKSLESIGYIYSPQPQKPILHLPFDRRPICTFRWPLRRFTRRCCGCSRLSRRISGRFSS